MPRAHVYGQVAPEEPAELDDLCDGNAQEFPLEALPALPEPNYREMRTEATTGCVVVLTLICLLVGFTRTFVLGSGLLPARVYLAVYILIHAEALIALICLVGILWGDPGVIKRSKDTCFPLPEEVVECLRHGRSMDHMENFRQDSQSFCVRCCVWRPKDAHHCKTCARCVRDFDHHCGVFGRCIAGSGFRGNMGYFKVIISMLFAGFATCAFSSVFSEASSDRPRHRGSAKARRKPGRHGI